MRRGIERTWGDQRGQALTELVVALVAIMVITAGLLQLSLLGVMHTGAMSEARRRAGAAAMQDAGSLSGPEYIAARTEGSDGMAYTRDDGRTLASVDDLQRRLVAYSHPDSLGQQVNSNSFTVMSQNQFPYLGFGLVEGKKDDRMALVPVIRSLVYRADEVEVEGKAWLTWTKGIY